MEATSPSSNELSRKRIFSEVETKHVERPRTAKEVWLAEERATNAKLRTFLVDVFPIIAEMTSRDNPSNPMETMRLRAFIMLEKREEQVAKESMYQVDRLTPLLEFMALLSDRIDRADVAYVRKLMEHDKDLNSPCALERLHHFNATLARWTELITLFLVCDHNYQRILNGLDNSISEINAAPLSRGCIDTTNEDHEPFSKTKGSALSMHLFDSLVDFPMRTVKQGLERIAPIHRFAKEFKPLCEDETIEVKDIVQCFKGEPFKCVGFRHDGPNGNYGDSEHVNFARKHFSTTLLFISEPKDPQGFIPWIEVTINHAQGMNAVYFKGFYDSSDYVFTQKVFSSIYVNPVDCAEGVSRHVVVKYNPDNLNDDEEDDVSVDIAKFSLEFNVVFHNPYAPERKKAKK